MSFGTTTFLLQWALIFFGIGALLTFLGMVMVAPHFVLAGFAIAILLPILLVFLLVFPVWPEVKRYFLILVCPLVADRPLQKSHAAFLIGRPPRISSFA